MNSGVDHRHLYSAVKLSATYQLEHGQPSSIFGTGVIAACEGNERFAIVSNRHILDRTWLEPLWKDATLKVSMDVWSARDSKVTFEMLPDRTYVHDDPSIDVAAIPFDRVVSKSQQDDSQLMLQSALPWEFLTRAEQDWHLLEPSETVFFPGYPEWYDRKDGRPIMRTGAIVSDPQFDYRRYDGDPSVRDGNRQILFEAFSSSGNSGSPVFAAQRGMPSSDHIEYKGVFHPAMLVGINAGHYHIEGDAIEDVNGKIHVTNWHVGLSRMFKTSAIIDVVKDIAQNYEWT